MEAVARLVRGEVSGCCLSGLEVEHCSSGWSGFGCCDSVFVGREPSGAGGLRVRCRSRNRVATRPVFSDRSHALFYASAGAGEERSTIADVKRERKPVLTIAYGMRGRTGMRREASSGSSSSSSSSESSDSEEERERRNSRKERARQRSRAARDVSVNALPVLDHGRVSPVRAPTQLTCAPKSTVKVCMGGKCKKMGSQTVLSAFQDSLAGNASVEAVPCKCLKKCGKAVNVTFGQGEEEPEEMVSEVEVDDVHDLLRTHFPQFSKAAPSPRL